MAEIRRSSQTSVWRPALNNPLTDNGLRPNLRRGPQATGKQQERTRSSMAATPPVCDFGWKAAEFSLRSEEHTSELQSLMRISYAVFCLKKKKKTITSTTII